VAFLQACTGVISVASSTSEDGVNKCKRLPVNILADTASFFTTDGSGATKENNSCASVQSIGIESLALGGGTSLKSGTSMAAPHVAGVVALLIEEAAKCGAATDPDSIEGYLTAGAVGVTTLPLDHPYITPTGDSVHEGILNAPASLAAVGCTPP